MNEIQLLSEINDKLNTLIALSATQGADRDEKIRILTSLGYANSEISKFTGIPKGTVDTVRAKVVKGKPKK